MNALAAESPHPGRWWTRLADGRLECRLCPRFCKLKEGQRGFCFVRRRVEDRLVLTTYGRSSGFCVDPIEKKPLNHFKGLRYVYVGNVHDIAGGSTWCPQCHNLLIERDGYVLGEWNLRDGACPFCGGKIPGRFDSRPGTWGGRRLPVRLE